MGIREKSYFSWAANWAMARVGSRRSLHRDLTSPPRHDGRRWLASIPLTSTVMSPRSGSGRQHEASSGFIFTTPIRASSPSCAARVKARYLLCGQRHAGRCATTTDWVCRTTASIGRSSTPMARPRRKKRGNLGGPEARRSMQGRTHSIAANCRRSPSSPLSGSRLGAEHFTGGVAVIPSRRFVLLEKNLFFRLTPWPPFLILGRFR